MYALAAIAVFPFLTLLLIGLSRAERVISPAALSSPERIPADAPAISEIPAD